MNSQANAIIAERPDVAGRADEGDRQDWVTIIVTPRERFGVAVESLQSVIDHTARPYRLVYIDGAGPDHIGEDLRRLCEAQGFGYIRTEHYLSPNRARNMGVAQADTRYVVFIDNDVIVSPGWLDALVLCAEDTGAEVVAPLTCQKEPLHTEIHQAGGEFADDHRAFLAAPPSDRRITDIHVYQGKKIGDVSLARSETQCCEFHCALVRRDVFDRFGMLDEALLATKEHIDFCMTVWNGGGRVMLEPASVVTYLFPGRTRPLTRADWEYFALRWSPDWQARSLRHFRDKWSLHDDPYFDRRQAMLSWRLSEGIAKPILSRFPLLGRSTRVRTACVKLLTAVLHNWSDRLARRHDRRAVAHATGVNALR